MPQAEGLDELGASRRGRAGKLAVSFARKPFEPHGIDRVGIHAQHIARCVGFEASCILAMSSSGREGIAQP
jgi:hypothetical protein